MIDSEAAHISGEGEVGLVEYHDFVSKEAFQFESGGSIPELTLRYETYGRLNEAKDNAILICHALTGNHHCAGVHRMDERKQGWWNFMVGPGKPIDTSRYFVICSNVLGGCSGSTGPESPNPLTGKRYNLDFPKLTVGDMVNAQAMLVDHLGIDRLHAVIGGSMGGMQTLQWAIAYPDRVGSYVALACCARHNAQAIAFNDTGRQAIISDPGWMGGDYPDGEQPREGLSIARMMAHITYLSDAGMEAKFGRKRRNKDAEEHFDVEFEVESYLRYQGQAFVSRFDANTYLYLTKALDRFDLHGPNGTLDETFERVTAPGLVVGFTSDWLYPPQGNRDIVEALLRIGKNATYAELAMDAGHDSFLLRAPKLDELIRSFLAR
ncbi:homoserine O-acetyltransferase MetX [Coraliomargarita akajimensis]|uniref:Homoserine O-acetyltransferase n=1 Tax=Coraliomargarita akajimensis (strain DSM 45221 / IAM 15411 / JCM 23193 / KCTC 12865 / 04OKA010-24) TaxID=583355 RepID=D5EJY7_CORAD|nr:homoserine O-acetyltransferase [Coraliomargarita akajimensis]ADE54736.1 homoserine O-acetyltransferase [Coraliomargarita akajimensis DSM 45221]